MTKKKGELWESQAEAVRMTGIPRRTLKEWIDQGHIVQGEFGYVDVIAVFKRDVERKKKDIERLKNSRESSDNPQVRLTIAQARKVEAEASLKELELDAAKGKVIDFEQASSEFQTALLTTRQRLLSLPTRLALQLSGMDDPKAIAALLEDIVREALSDLSVSFAESEDVKEELEGDSD